MKALLLLTTLLSLDALANVYSKYPWRSTRSLSVCYASPEAYPRSIGQLTSVQISSFKSLELTHIQNWIEEEYSSERTGITFYGFGPCSETVADIVLFKGSGGGLIGGQASVGPKNPGSVSGYPKARGYVLIYDIKKSSVVHEFGHVAGLMHEHLHPEAFSREGKCVQQFMRSPSPIDAQNFYTSYDYQSVMNYCAINGLGGENLGLSSGDLNALRELYP